MLLVKMATASPERAGIEMPTTPFAPGWAEAWNPAGRIPAADTGSNDAHSAPRAANPTRMPPDRARHFPPARTRCQKRVVTKRRTGSCRPALP